MTVLHSTTRGLQLAQKKTAAYNITKMFHGLCVYLFLPNSSRKIFECNETNSVAEAVSSMFSPLSSQYSPVIRTVGDLPSNNEGVQLS